MSLSDGFSEALMEDEEDHQDSTSPSCSISVNDHILVTTNEGEACLYALIALGAIVVERTKGQ